jgi:hypothetical protein
MRVTIAASKLVKDLIQNSYKIIKNNEIIL